MSLGHLVGPALARLRSSRNREPQGKNQDCQNSIHLIASVIRYSDLRTNAAVKGRRGAMLLILESYYNLL